MALLPPVSFEGAYLNPKTGISYPYAGTAVVVVDSQGRESMHVRGSVRRGNREKPVVVLGVVDRHQSFVGREQQAATDCLVQRFEQQQGDFALTEY